MKNQNTIADINQYMQKLKVLDEQAKHEDGRKGYSLSKNIPFLVLTTAVGALATPFIFDGILPIYSVLTGIPGGLLGFFAPKIIHGICAKSKGKIGQKYAKNKLADYIDAVYKYDLLCLKSVVNAKSINEISDADFKKFVDQVKLTATNYMAILGSYVGKVINKRVNDDYKKIVNLLKNDSQNHTKIEKIIEKNRYFVGPWIEIYNQYGQNAKSLMQYACRFDSTLQMPSDRAFYADDNLLEKKVKIYMSQNGLAPTNQTVVSSGSYKSRLEQIQTRDRQLSQSQDYIDVM